MEDKWSYVKLYLKKLLRLLIETILLNGLKHTDKIMKILKNILCFEYQMK